MSFNNGIERRLSWYERNQKATEAAIVALSLLIGIGFGRIAILRKVAGYEIFALTIPISLLFAGF